jgi:hypothetical protein
MGNLNKELGTLFKRYLIRKEEEAKKPTVFHNANYYKGVWGDKNTFNGTIFFYEWSDITRIPIKYFSLSLFEKFLADCDLELEPWQRDMIPSLGDVYITCKANSKELLIRSSYDALKAAVACKSVTQLYLPPTKPDDANKLRLSPMYKEQYY